jgi:Zn-finger nucleic acid-binding protein
MKCPRDQALLSIRSIEGHSGYRCPSCHGGWLPAKFVQSLEYSGEFRYSVFTDAVAQGASDITALACPAGCGQLRATTFAETALCWCPNCQGSWFDFGAIGELLAKFARRDTTLGKAVAADAGFSVLVAVLSALFS